MRLVMASTCSQRRPDSLEQLGLLRCSGDPHPLELVVEANVGEEVVAVLVEVQERSGAAVEGSPRLLPERVDLAELRQQWLHPVQRIAARVPHCFESWPRRSAGSTSVPSRWIWSRASC